MDYWINQINDRNHIKQINQINQKDQIDHKVKDKDLTPKTTIKRSEKCLLDYA